MKFNTHYNLTGKHAYLAPSKHHWVQYTTEKFEQAFAASSATRRGTMLHDLARKCIELNVKLPKTKSALNLFVNDAIGYRMNSEQILFYSYNAFGTTDAIAFRNNLLRIHDLKTGYGRVYMEQLEIYAALFCLEYRHEPNNIDLELRIYQSTKIVVHEPHPSTIKRIMEKIILFDKKIEELKALEEGSWR